jgi:hypothetical protein
MRQKRRLECFYSQAPHQEDSASTEIGAPFRDMGAYHREECISFERLCKQMPNRKLQVVCGGIRTADLELDPNAFIQARIFEQNIYSRRESKFFFKLMR